MVTKIGMVGMFPEVSIFSRIIEVSAVDKVSNNSMVG